MTNSVLDLAKSYLSDSFVKEAASKLNESPDGISKALSAAIPAIFAGIGNKASQDSSFMSTVLDKAKTICADGSLNKLNGIVNQVPTDITAPASGFVKSIFGNIVHHFTEKISSFAGIKQSSAHAVLNAAGIASLGSIGKDAVENNSNVSDLTGFFKNHLSFLSELPASLGLSSLFSQISYGAEHSVNEVKKAYEKEEKKGAKWLWPLIIGIIILALLLFFLLRSCNKGLSPVVPSDTTAVSVPKAPVPTSVKLPSGAVVNAYKNGIEDQMVAFLNSPAFKNATEDSLKTKWFSFDRINFKTGTADLDSASYPQINNLISVLKEYPTTKIKFGAYTDKTGDSIANMKLSQLRADALKKAFAAVGAQIVGAEGYGSQFAKYPATAPDSLRAKDRNMSIRFVK